MHSEPTLVLPESPSPVDSRLRVLLTGATGYVGQRLRPLLKQRCRVRCLVRNPHKIPWQVGRDDDLVRGDVMCPESLDAALSGMDVAYYLVHLMGRSHDFESNDRKAATNFAAAAKRAGVQRIVYLGGLGDESDPRLSPHLRSRHEVGRILRNSGVETIEFRSSVILGEGSLSFEMIRSLTDRLPVMICPKWLATPTQPIAVDDVLEYLIAALDLPRGKSQVLEVGCPEVATYGALIREYARQKDIQRWLLSVPLLTPYLSSLWLGFVTPATAAIGRHLIEGLRNPTVVTNSSAADAFPNIRPVCIPEAIARALAKTTSSKASLKSCNSRP